MTIQTIITAINQTIQSFSMLIWLGFAVWSVQYLGKSIKQLTRKAPDIIDKFYDRRERLLLIKKARVDMRWKKWK